MDSFSPVYLVYQTGPACEVTHGQIKPRLVSRTAVLVGDYCKERDGCQDGELAECWLVGEASLC